MIALRTEPRTTAYCLCAALSLALLFAGCGGGDGPSPFPQPLGRISGITTDAASGLPSNASYVIATAQNPGRVQLNQAVRLSPAQAIGTYTMDVPPGTYLVQCYVEYEGERYFGDSLNGVVVQPAETTPNVNLTAPSVITVTTYNSDGDHIGAWDWLRDVPRANSSTWTFAGINRLLDVTAHFMMLVTNTANGGAGYGTTVQLTYTGNEGPTAANLALPPSGSPPDNQYPPDPEGYTTRATQAVNQNYVTTGGALTIELNRINGEHVGTAQQSIWLVNYSPPSG
jgi:hypothetical protein